jgi:acyl carrier protein
MINSNNIGDRIKSFVLQTFPLARKKALNPKDDLLESGIIDSLGILDLVAFVEKEFGIAVSDEDLLPENFNSVEHLTAFVQNRAVAAKGNRE